MFSRELVWKKMVKKFHEKKNFVWVKFATRIFFVKKWKMQVDSKKIFQKSSHEKERRKGHVLYSILNSIECSLYYFN